MAADDASAMAELIARAMHYKSKAPRPEAELQNLVEWMSKHDPQALAKLRANYSDQIASAGSAGGPQAKTAAQKRPSKNPASD